MNKRILLILKSKDISASKFADEIGVQRSSISHILSGRNNPSLDFIQKVLTRFPDINSDWILTGKGSMYSQPDLFSSAEINKTVKRPDRVEIREPERDIPVEKALTDNETEEIILEKAAKPKHIKPLVKNEEKEEKKPVSQGIIMKAADKKIERIIIFYSDKSCIEYIPE